MKKNKPFLFYDSGPHPDRIIIFVTLENLNLWKTSDEWFLDGTFKVCPVIFHQMYSILVKVSDGKTVPVIYSLLPSKSAATYRRFLRIVCDVLDGAHPQVVHVDFEIAFVRELEVVFPSVRVIGCNFHFNQCLWCHIQGDAPLRKKYMEDNDFALNVRRFAAISSVPLTEIESTFEEFLNSDFVLGNGAVLINFINYFETTWVGRFRNPPLMKLEWWNVREATLSSTGRTSNEIEGWHSAFAGRLGACNPTFFKLVEQLQVEQGLAEFVITNTTAQGSGASSKPVYRDRQKRLFEIVSSFGSRSSSTFLEAIAHNISF